MNALELKNRIKTWDDNKTFLKITAISILITGVFFPINLSLNPNVDPIVYEHPFLLGFGFIAFVLVVMMAFVCGSIFTLLILDSYLIFSPKILNSTRKTVSNLISKDEDLLDRWTDGILSRTAKSNQKYDDPKFEELEKKYERQHTEHLESIQEIKTELKTQNEKFNEKELEYNNIIGRQGQHIFGLHWVLRRVLRQNSKLVKENNELRQEKNEKLQTMNENTHSRDITENIDLKKFKEDL